MSCLRRIGNIYLVNWLISINALSKSVVIVVCFNFRFWEGCVVVLWVASCSSNYLHDILLTTTTSTTPSQNPINKSIALTIAHLICIIIDNFITRHHNCIWFSYHSHHSTHLAYNWSSTVNHTLDNHKQRMDFALLRNLNKWNINQVDWSSRNLELGSLIT